MFLKGFPEPTFRIETSPGNETWLWKLEGDTRSPEHNTGLALIRAYMIERGLTDALHDSTRYLRLPWGHNSKPHYRTDKGRAPAVGYTDCSPEKSATLDQIGRVLIGRDDWRDADVPLSAQTSGAMAAAGGGSRPRHADMDDAMVQMAAVIGLEPKQRVKGVVDALCPNFAEHGARAETGFSFIGSGGECFCHHASCSELKTPDFLRMIRCRYEEDVASLNKAGKNTEALPPRAKVFEMNVLDEASSLKAKNAKVVAEQQKKIAPSPFERGALALLKEGQLIVDLKGAIWLSYNGRLHSVSNKDRAILQICAQLGHNLTGSGASNLFEYLINSVSPNEERVEVSFRQAEFTQSDGKSIVYINLMNNGQAICIDEGGWTALPLKDAPIAMAERLGGLPMPMPVKSPSGRDFFDVLKNHITLAPFSKTSDAKDLGVRQRAVLLCTLTAALYRPGTVPHLMISGQQGSGKTTLAKRLTDLTDPDAAAVSASLPSEADKIFNIVNNRLNLVADNASGVSKAKSDVLCAIASGSAHAARKLYTDADRAIFQAKASVIFTSVLTDIVRLPDLAQRTLQFDCAPISRKHRLSERSLNENWKQDYPALLGALYDALARGLSHLSKVSSECESGALETPRLSDAAIIAEAVARGMGWPVGLCMAALVANEQSEAHRLLEENPLALRLRAFLEQQPNQTWEGAVSELNTALSQIPAFNLPTWDQNRLPFNSQFQRLWPGIEEAWGISRVQRRTSKQRLIQLTLKAP
jgi:hypothetical protein